MARGILTSSKDQWKRKKQTKEQAKAARIAKLNPDNAKSAKDVMDEQARKRKRDEEGEISEVEGIMTERPKEGLKPVQKKQRKDHVGNGDKQTEGKELNESENLKIERVREKRKEKAEAKKAKRQARQENKSAKAAEKTAATQAAADHEEDLSSDSNEDETAVDFEHLEDPEKQTTPGPETSASSRAPSLDSIHNASGTSSISSIATQNPESSDKITKKPKLEVKIGHDEFVARLQKKIAELRAARKADNEDGTPAQTRTELIEQRRKKAEEKKANKKALRQQAKEEERRQKEEALARGSPLMSPSGMSPAHIPSPLSEPTNNFSFGKVAFENGQSMTADLNAVLGTQKKKGPQDPFSAFQASKNRTHRLSVLDAEKRTDIEEKDMWLNARKRAQGERPRDNGSLLKKALKRKENRKKKSEKEWNDRLEGVAQSQAARQKKRTENLQKRKEERGSKGKGGSKTTKKKARPGFEGSFRARSKAK